MGTEWDGWMESIMSREGLPWGKGVCAGPGWFTQGLIPYPPLLCPCSLATGPCGLACQLPLLLAPRWAPNVGDTSKRVGIREKPGVAPPLSPVAILGVAASQP